MGRFFWELKRLKRTEKWSEKSKFQGKEVEDLKRLKQCGRCASVL